LTGFLLYTENIHPGRNLPPAGDHCFSTWLGAEVGDEGKHPPWAAGPAGFVPRSHSMKTKKAIYY